MDGKKLGFNGKGTVFVTPEEFECSVSVARLAVQLARMQEIEDGSESSADKFLNQALDLICQAREMLDDRRICV
jgi:hypothetical protein